MLVALSHPRPEPETLSPAELAQLFDAHAPAVARVAARLCGRGAHVEPISRGVTGVAYIRGTELIDFKQIRV